MVYDKVWQGLARYGMICGNAYVNFTFYGIALGNGPIHMWRSRCQLEVLFTGPVHK